MKSIHIAVLAVCVWSTTALAQQTPVVPDSTDASDVNSIFVFNRVCYGQVPNLEGIRRMAGQLAWTPLEPGDLEAFEPQGGADTVEGWDAPIGQRVFRVITAQGDVPPALVNTFPDFANGQSTSCTLVLDGTDKSDVFIAELTGLAGKEPASRDVATDGQLSTTWAGGNADVKVFLSGKTGVDDAGSLINVVVLTK
ncbi:MAG: hypothetical protein AAF141_12350 [Pseudomonadota bacterium]